MTSCYVSHRHQARAGLRLRDAAPARRHARNRALLHPRCGRGIVTRGSRRPQCMCVGLHDPLEHDDFRDAQEPLRARAARVGHRESTRLDKSLQRFRSAICGVPAVDPATGFKPRPAACQEKSSRRSSGANVSCERVWKRVRLAPISCRAASRLNACRCARV